ncbi:MAG: hypothetical protein JWP92_241 [Caulobacter sp.]|nr:hypothetical protein [Caulobacter sp.]
MAERTCGACGLCCKLMGVAALAKAPHSWCGHFQKGVGCGVYESRPQACADFSCYWLKAEGLDDRWRPDRARFILHREDGGRRLVVEVDPASPNAWRQAPYYATLKAWAARGAADGLSLDVLVGQRGFEIHADHDVDLGVVRPAQASARSA